MAGGDAKPSGALAAFFKPRKAAPKRPSDESTASTEGTAAKKPKAASPKKPAATPAAAKPPKPAADTAAKAAPAGDATDWTGAVPYAALAACFAKIEATTKRLEIQAIVRDLLVETVAKAPHDLEAVVFLLCNKVAPAFDNLEMGIGDSLLQKAIANAFGRDAKHVKEAYKTEGDLGIVAEDARKKQRFLGFGSKPKPLAAAGVLKAYREICAISGSKSQDQKVGKMQKLMISATPPEARYVTRGLQGKLRIGLAESTVLVSLAHALCLAPPPGAAAAEAALLEGPKAALPKLPEISRETTGAQAAAALENDARRALAGAELGKKRLAKDQRLLAAEHVVKQCYAEAPSYGVLVAGALSTPLWALPTKCALATGVPVFPMLAKPTKSVGEVLKRLAQKSFTCEHKYDGERFQAHLSEGGAVRVFSRNLQDTTKKWPEVSTVLKEAAAASGTTSFVLDAEVVAVDPATGQLLPFQRLSTRKKETTEEDAAKGPSVIVMAFDLLLLNGESLLRAPLRARREKLRRAFAPVENRLAFATSTDVAADDDPTEAAEQISQALEEAVTAKSEGLMVKTLDDNATYEPSKRSLNWLKLKKDYLDGVGDSLDLVVVGGIMGRGKRTGVFGAYLCACLDADSGDLQTVCKLGTGFSDEALKKFHAQAQPLVRETKADHVVTGDALEKEVTHWFEPKMVWEIMVADLTLSDAHKAALGRVEAGRGVGARFPRLVKEREDKAPDQATTADQVLEMFMAQDSVKDTLGGDAMDEDDDGYL